MLPILLLFTLYTQSVEKLYSKTYYSNGNLAAEGWTLEDQKIDYWFYYFDNGNKKSQGKYQDNKKINWWIFYNSNGSVLRKCEYKNDILNGLTIMYDRDKIIYAEKYENGIKKKKYFSIEEYKKDH